MACDLWRDKIGAYADGELSGSEMRSLGKHLPGCPSCTADLLAGVQLKHAVKAAGERYTPSTELRRRVQQGIGARDRQARVWGWVPRLAATAAFAALAVAAFGGWIAYQQAETFGELADLHVATLASSAPVDVVSTDRHTVKPWFAGKIPFTFNLPELANTSFVLEGGRISYLGQAPGAQLIFRDGNHRISVFIFQDRAESRLTPRESSSRQLTFNVESWSLGGLRYFLISDVEMADIRKLSELLRSAARS
jgi:anti-sigma factor RsiW